MITSQIPVDRWHDMIGVPTLADAILDRVIHNAYRIDLSGESLRKQRSLSWHEAGSVCLPAIKSVDGMDGPAARPPRPQENSRNRSGHVHLF